ncbi:hypothetical protein WJX84_007438, partial [Apatococcus fuscideae]
MTGTRRTQQAGESARATRQADASQQRIDFPKVAKGQTAKKKPTQPAPPTSTPKKPRLQHLASEQPARTSSTQPRKAARLAPPTPTPPTPAQRPRRSVRTQSETPAAVTEPPSKKSARKGSPTQHGKAKKGGAKQIGKREPRIQKQYLQEASINDVAYRVGDAAYIAMEGMTSGADEDDDEEPCELCGEAHDETARLECDGCLRAFHMGCLIPPLTAVPAGAWLCPGCVAGKPAPPRSSGLTLRERFLAGNQGVGLAHIDSLWTTGANESPQADGSNVQYSGRWYVRPEETHTGRKKHHGAREVFLTQQSDANCAVSLLRKCRVCSPDDYEDCNQGTADVEANDVYLCEYQDGTFKPIYAYWMEKGLIPTRNMRPGGASARKQRNQGGQKWAAQQQGAGAMGSAEIPEEARAPPGNPLAAVQRCLALTAPPKKMLGREAEHQRITAFVEEALEPGAEGQCLYISGVPGTGKTATVRDAMRCLRRRAECGEVAPFQFVELNSLQLPSPQHAYCQLFEAMTGDRRGPSAAAAALEELFSSAGKRSGSQQRLTVLLVDEMDLLVTRRQSVLYNLFEWPGRKNSRLAVIGVANTMDLPERLLQRIASRLAGRRLNFHPYTRAQLQAILGQRLAHLTPLYEPNALDYACRKVAAVSGDARRVLEMCRRAAGFAEAQARAAGKVPEAASAGGEQAAEALKGIVRMGHVDRVVQETANQAHMRLIGTAPRLEKALLACLLMETRATGHSEASMAGVLMRVQALWIGNLEDPVCAGDVVAAAGRLAAKRVILADPAARR